MVNYFLLLIGSYLILQSYLPSALRKSLNILMGLGSCLFIGVTFHQDSQDKQNYNQGFSFYKQGQCTQAIIYFQKVTQGNRWITTTDFLRQEAYQYWKECKLFNQGQQLQQIGDFNRSFSAYLRLAKFYPETHLSGFIVKALEEIFTTAKPGSLANPESCLFLGELSEKKWINLHHKNVPLVYLTCVKLYQNRGNWKWSIDLAEQFITYFPNHPALTSVQRLLALSILAQTTQQSPSLLPPPTPIKTSKKNKLNTVELHLKNSSSKPLRIVYQNQANLSNVGLILIPACRDCQEQSSCSPQAITTTVNLPVNNYQVVVEALENSTSITPFRGIWQFKSGLNYESCFYITSH